MNSEMTLSDIVYCVTAFTITLMRNFDENDIRNECSTILNYFQLFVFTWWPGNHDFPYPYFHLSVKLKKGKGTTGL